MSSSSARAPMMVEQPPADFVGRPEHLNRLEILAGEEPTGSVAIAAALKGAGGYGKTTLARALCHDEVVRETFDDGILWVTLGETPPDPSRAIEDLIVTLTGTASGSTSLESRKARLDALLADRHALLVIDDVWAAADLDPFLVGGRRCARLITTRDSSTFAGRDQGSPGGRDAPRRGDRHAQCGYSRCGSGRGAVARRTVSESGHSC